MTILTWDANKYPVGTKLQDLGWVGTTNWTCTELGATGRKYWSAPDHPSGQKAAFDLDLRSNVEVLVACDFTANELGVAKIGLSTNIRGSKNVTTFNPYRYEIGSDNYHYVPTPPTYTTNNVVTGLDANKAIAIRYRLGASNDVKMKAWGSAVGGLEVNEPASWNHIGTVITYNFASYININDCENNSLTNYVSLISIATAGETAVFTLGDQSVVTPTNLTATPTDTTAALGWS